MMMKPWKLAAVAATILVLTVVMPIQAQRYATHGHGSPRSTMFLKRSTPYYSDAWHFEVSKATGRLQLRTLQARRMRSSFLTG